MGTTLQNGVYLPNEGERNCYAGLKTNWEILDQKVADVTALQQAVAGALHREIVESLPTTDIDPNTIYMVLSGTSATENVYNEFMYVNNAWELIGTSATDLTNYYTKGEVDGLLLLKANASDLTSHTGDTTIHVTTADKNKWNNGVAQAYVFRYSSTALVASSTNSNTLLDNTDNLKVGDKVIDSSGVLFSITAIDTANSTFSIGTALIDLAQDSDVVHKSGYETVGGNKTFSSTLRLTAYPSIRMYMPDDAWDVLPSTSQQSEIGFTDKNLVTVSYFAFQHRTDSNEPFRTCWRQQKMDGTNGYYGINFNNLGNFYPENNDGITLGRISNRWKSVYATNYYYGNDNVEFSTKFVTTDTAQTISGNKTFSSNVNVYNSDSATDTANIVLKNSKAERGSTTNIGEQNISFVDKDNAQICQIKCEVDANGYSSLVFQCTNSSDSSTGIRLRRTSTGTSILPTSPNSVHIGNPAIPYFNVQTNRVNSLEPSSLSLPSGNVSDFIDISSYFSNTATGDTNSYTAPANGWIYLRLGDITSCQVVLNDSSNRRLWGTSATGDVEQIIMPILKNTTLTTTWVTNLTVNVATARFIPCQGNV